MRVLLIQPVWIDVGSAREARDVAQAMTQAAETSFLAEAAKRGFNRADAEELVKWAPVQIVSFEAAA